MTKRSSLTAIVLAASLAIGCGAAATQTTQPVCPLASPAPTSAETVDDGLDKLTDEQLVRKLLETTNASSTGKQIADSMMDTFRKMPNLPSAFIDRFQKNLKPETLVEIIVPIYLKHYDRKTLMASIRFYGTEAGRKLLLAQPAVTTETMEAGKLWGTELAKKTMKEIGGP